MCCNSVNFGGTVESGKTKKRNRFDEMFSPEKKCGVDQNALTK